MNELAEYCKDLEAKMSALAARLDAAKVAAGNGQPIQQVMTKLGANMNSASGYDSNAVNQALSQWISQSLKVNN